MLAPPLESWRLLGEILDPPLEMYNGRNLVTFPLPQTCNGNDESKTKTKACISLDAQCTINQRL